MSTKKKDVAKKRICKKDRTENNPVKNKLLIEARAKFNPGNQLPVTLYQFLNSAMPESKACYTSLSISLTSFQKRKIMKSLISEIKAKIVLTVIILLLSLTVVYKLIVPTQEFWIQAASVVPIFSLFYYYMKIQHRKYKVLKDFTGHKNIIQVWVWRWNDNIVEEKRWYLRKMFEKIFQDFYNSRPEGYSHDYDCLADIVKFSNKLRDYYKLILNDKQEYLSTLSLEEVLNLKNLFIINFENQVVVRIVENFKEYTTEELIKMVKVVPPVENKAVYRIFEEQVMKRKWREDMSQEEKRNTGRQIID